MHFSLTKNNPNKVRSKVATMPYEQTMPLWNPQSLFQYISWMDRFDFLFKLPRNLYLVRIFMIGHDLSAASDEDYKETICTIYLLLALSWPFLLGCIKRSIDGFARSIARPTDKEISSYFFIGNWQFYLILSVLETNTCLNLFFYFIKKKCLKFFKRNI